MGPIEGGSGHGYLEDDMNKNMGTHPLVIGAEGLKAFCIQGTCAFKGFVCCVPRMRQVSVFCKNQGKNQMHAKNLL